MGESKPTPSCRVDDDGRECAKCGKYKPWSEYTLARTKRTGHQSRCRACTLGSEDAARRPKVVRKLTTYRDDDGKDCPRCDKYKSWDEYNKNSRTRDGHQVYCRPCARGVARASEAHHAEARAVRHAERLARRLADPNQSPNKTCTQCAETKPLVEFYVSRKGANGRMSHCRQCDIKRSAEYQAARREKVREYYRKRNQDPAKRKRAEGQKRGSHLRMYGLTAESHDVLLAAQGGVCAICGESGQNWAERSLNVDHDHDTNEVRGLLCGRCNLGLGYFKDDVKRLAAAIEYLHNPPASVVKTG